jgi:hypothetical protein
MNRIKYALLHLCSPDPTHSNIASDKTIKTPYITKSLHITKDPHIMKDHQRYEKPPMLGNYVPYMIFLRHTIIFRFFMLLFFHVFHFVILCFELFTFCDGGCGCLITFYVR